MKYIINSEKKIVTQKATMEKPEHPPTWGIQYHHEWIKYNQHLDSLKSFPAEWVTAEMDGLEVELDKDFRLQYQAIMVYGEPFYYDVNEETYNEVKPEFRRIVAVAIPAQDDKPVLLGRIVDDFENKKETFIPAEQDEWNNLLDKGISTADKILKELRSQPAEPVEERKDELWDEVEDIFLSNGMTNERASNSEVNMARKELKSKFTISKKI